MATRILTAKHKVVSRYLPTEVRWIQEALTQRRSATRSAVSLRIPFSRLLAQSISLGLALSHRMDLELYRRMYLKVQAPVEGDTVPGEKKPLLVRIHIFGTIATRVSLRAARSTPGLVPRMGRSALGLVRKTGRSTRRLGSKLGRAVRRTARLYAVARDEVSLINTGMLAELSYASKNIQVSPARVMYLVYNSLPYHSAGYATRSQGLVTGIRALGFDSTIVSRLGYPHVFSKFRDVAPVTEDQVEGVPYIRLNSDLEQIFFSSTRRYIRLNTAAAIGAAEKLRPAIVHGVSNFVTGLTAIGVARALGIPSVYEVRGLWEITALSRDPSYVDTLRYAQAVRLETEACLGADRVIAITEALKGELVRRGVPAEKIEVVPNGVDTDRFRPRVRDDLLGAKLGLKPEHVVIGYVGSILDYEGLDDLLQALRLCVDQGLTFMRLLIVGDGAAHSSCVDLARELNLDEYTIFTGRVPYDEVEAYYSLVDIAPFPRKPLPVTEMVSPLKPFEAMAMGKCVIVSSVAALAEIIADRPIGFVHEKGSIEALAEALTHVAKNRDLRLRVGEEARRFVVEERDWRILAQRVVKVYEKLPATE